MVVGNDVWIGFRAAIMSGVKVGDGAVIGAGAIVTADVPPYGIVVGVPGRLLRRRFDDGTVDALQRIRWWDWDLATLKANAGLIRDVPQLIRLYGDGESDQEAH